MSLPTDGKGEQPAREAASSWHRELEAKRTEHGKPQAAAHADAAGKQATAGRKPDGSFQFGNYHKKTRHDEFFHQLQPGTICNQLRIFDNPPRRPAREARATTSRRGYVRRET